MFPVVRVNSEQADQLEPLGTKRKFWFRGELHGESGRILFKAEERGTGEDWAEKIACELAGRLGLPRVMYELAIESAGNRPGVVCANCAPPPLALVMGNQLMLARDPNYPAEDGNRYRTREHTVNAVAETVAELEMPAARWCERLPEGINTALDVFVGYIMLDAWVANQDRHHENWAAIRDGGDLQLAPTFDHGASLARNIGDQERQERLTSKDVNRQVPKFARKARSAFYAGIDEKRPMTTVAAWTAYSQKAPEASMIWCSRLEAISEDDVTALLVEVPPNRLSRVGRAFTLALLMENRRRILAGEDQ